MLKLKSIHNHPIDAVTYLVYDTDRCIIIDPFDFDAIQETLNEIDCIPLWLILTHEHYDHIAAVNVLREKYRPKLICSAMCSDMIQNPRKNGSEYFNLMMELHGTPLPTTIMPYSAAPADVVFQDSLRLEWNGVFVDFKVTPGHSPGSICIRLGEWLFTGDSLLNETPVAMGLPGGNRKEYEKSTRPFLLSCDTDLTVMPGHGESFHLGDSKYLYNVEE